MLKKKIKGIIYEIDNNIHSVNENKNKKVKKEKIKIYKKCKGHISFVSKKNKRKNDKNDNYDNKKFIVNPEKKIKLKINNKSNSKIKKIKNKYIDEEINGLSYNLALKHDRRNYCDYYISLLKTKHNLIFALCNNIDYNSGIIKIDLFFIGFAIDYTINALFFNDDTMHEIYESKGQFDLLTQFPIIVYSYLISFIFNTPLNSLALSNDLILTFKENKSKIDIMSRTKKLKKILTIKFTLYFIISFLFLIFFWYYIALFGVVYKNTQIHLLKDTLMSFWLSLVAPFFIYLVPGIFRIPSLYNGNRKCLYNFSKILHFF